MEIDYEGLREYRDNRHAVEVEESKSYMYDKEYTLKVTHNGNHRSAITVNREEAKMVIKALEGILNEN